MKRIAEPNGLWPLPHLLGYSCLRVFRLKELGHSVGGRLEISNDAKHDCGRPRIYVQWINGEDGSRVMSLFVEETQGKPEKLREWKVA